MLEGISSMEEFLSGNIVKVKLVNSMIRKKFFVKVTFDQRLNDAYI